MTDWGRIHRGLWRHGKRELIDLAALGLWTDCISWSKDKGTKGFIPDERVADYPHLAAQLLQARMWLRGEGGFVYNDWDEWSGQAVEKPRTLAAKLVESIIPHDHPSVVRQQLAAKVAELLEEGQEVYVLEAALKVWLTKSSASASLLPHLISDVLRTRSDAGITQALRDAWRTGNVEPLEAHGYVYTSPDPPPALSVQETREFNLAKKREWVQTLQEELTK